MNILIDIFHIVLYQPLFNALVLLYQYLPGHDFGIAVIVLTILTRLLFYPLMIKAIKSQKALSEIQPKIQEIQRKYKNDKQKQAKATMEMYHREKINPFSGCLPLLIQLPILLALYRVFWRGLQPAEQVYLYNFVHLTSPISSSFLGILDLAKPNIELALLAGIFQFIQTKMITPHQKKNKGGQPQMMDIMQKQMVYFFPIITVFILWKLPAAIGLYWIVTSLFSIVQQYLVFKKPGQKALAQI